MLLCLGGIAAARAAPPAEAPVPVGLEQLTRLDTLPRFRRSAAVGAFSSYDRTGGNDDGFSGRYSFLRKEGDGLVIADLKGPGVIYRIWTPTPTDDPLEIYFDGEAEPRVKMKYRELFDGSHPPFSAPVVGYGGGGFWCYLPLPFRKSCKIVIRAPRVQFYQVNWAVYPDDDPLTTFDPQAPGLTEQLRRATALIGSAGQDLTRFTAAGRPVRVDRIHKVLPPGRPLTLWETNHGGRILGLRLGPADLLAGKARDIVLRITWDGDKDAAVLCPVGDFFGASWGDPATRGLMLGTTANRDYVYFPMPFDRSAQIELLSQRGTAVDVNAEVISIDLPRRKDEGRFYAVWRRENPTTVGKSFTWLDTPGRGHVVGVTLQAQGFQPGITPFFEGDDEVTLDGDLAIHGTGSEDAFNGGWYDVPGRWEARTSFPFSGCLDYQRPQARSGAYRFFLTDAYSYRKSVHLAIEHAPEGNRIPTDYVGMAYLYAENHPVGAGTILPLAKRKVIDPERLVFNPGWYMPLHSFSAQNATVARKEERIGKESIRFLSLRAQGEDVFGPHHVALLCDVPAAGKYRVSAEALEGPDAGILQLFHQEHTRGPAVDLYAETRGRRKAFPLGDLDLKAGLNPVFLKLVGKNPRATGTNLELITLTLERIH